MKNRMNENENEGEHWCRSAEDGPGLHWGSYTFARKDKVHSECNRNRNSSDNQKLVPTNEDCKVQSAGDFPPAAESGRRAGGRSAPLHRCDSDKWAIRHCHWLGKSQFVWVCVTEQNLAQRAPYFLLFLLFHQHQTNQFAHCTNSCSRHFPFGFLRLLSLLLRVHFVTLAI